MRLACGDVVLRNGEFALVWQSLKNNRILIFPITDAREGFAPFDMVVQSWPELSEASRYSSVVIRLTQARYVDPVNWLKLMNMGFGLNAIRAIWSRLIPMADSIGPQIAWRAPDRAPILAS